MLSWVWFTDSLMSSAAIVGILAIRRANSSVRSPSSSAGKILLTIPSRYASSASIESPVSISSLVLRGPNSHGWAKYSTPHIPRRVPPAAVVLEVVVPLLEHQLFRSLPGATTVLPGGMLLGARQPLGEHDLRTQ